MLHKKLFNLVHLSLKIIKFSCLRCCTRRQFFTLLLFLHMIFLNVVYLIDVLLFAVLFKIFAMSCFRALWIQQTSVVFVLSFWSNCVSRLTWLSDSFEVRCNHMLVQGFVMVFWALKPVVKFIYADCALVKLILSYDKVVFVLHLTKQVKIHVTLLQTYHEILVI